MYQATCSVTECDFAAMDSGFDHVADALIEHHELAHGMLPDGALPERLALYWKVGKQKPAKQEPQTA